MHFVIMSQGPPWKKIIGFVLAEGQRLQAETFFNRPGVRGPFPESSGVFVYCAMLSKFCYNYVKANINY